MSHTVLITKINEGPRHVILHLYLKSDGVSPDLNGEVIFDPVADASPPLRKTQRMTIEEIWYDLDKFNMRFDFDDLTDPPVWTMSTGASNHVRFDRFGGLVDRSGIDGTGKLLLSTIGFTDAAMQGTIVVKMRK